jgi:integrase
MSRTKLTKIAVDALEPRDSEYVEWCGKLAGFGCRVRPSGAKSFIALYRVKGAGAVRKFTIGKYGEGGFTVDEARKEAGSILSDAVKGIDRAANKTAERREMTVPELCDLYIEEGCGHKKASTKATDKAALNNHVKPFFKAKRISDVTTGDIERFVQRVANPPKPTANGDRKRGSDVRGGQGVANRTVRVISAMFSFAIRRGLLEKNPRSGVQLAAEKPKQSFLSEAQIQRLGETLREALEPGLPWQFNEDAKAKHRPKDAETRREKLSPHAIGAIRLLLATGMRSGEVLGLEWSHVDFERGFLNLPDSKTGAKTVVLSDLAIEILRGLARIATKDHPYVIEGEGENKPRTDLKRPWRRITAHAGLSKFRLHDLRHTYASIGAEEGMGLSMVGKLLGHTQAATTLRYTHFDDTAQRRAANMIASQVAGAIGNQGNVVPLKAAS